MTPAFTKTDRRKFLQRLSAAGLIAAGGTAMVVSCTQKRSAEPLDSTKDWSSDPEWRAAKYGSWKGPGVPEGSGPMDAVLLKDYAPKSSLVTQETFVPKSKFTVVDVHAHDYPGRMEDKTFAAVVDEWVRVQEEVGVAVSVILTGATGAGFDRLVKHYLEPYPERFQLFCGIIVEDIDQPDYSERAVAELERCYSLGARGVGEVSDKGFGISKEPSLPREQWLHPDDSRLDPIWGKCAELDLPVNLHIADHPSSWEAPDVFQERTPIFQRFNQHQSEGLYYDQLLEVLPSLLQKHPDTRFIACHLANLGHDLARLSRMLDLYPNLFVDISARDYEVGRQPRAAASFLTKYADRVLFGTDMGMDKEMYQSWWRLLESADEHMVGRVWWRYYGLALPDQVLEALYYKNTRRVLNWTTI